MIMFSSINSHVYKLYSYTTLKVKHSHKRLVGWVFILAKKNGNWLEKEQLNFSCDVFKFFFFFLFFF